ncbi:alpha/beta fold hydrolase [Magnetospira sp. QH-2]|uniref:alpha/beta fold hydrolase n=1 Tax=Magnetospira sp. (strain QH-2) TaxID=1288970 RepID=UPI0003E815BF|nr:alpha/beta fold hydrolase [Magnetospira sp. QH-2]CCQ72510.1 conserved protein of unknown function [Magnetospira sp. QH-2]
MTIYIEGDGVAYISRSRPSTDPTPDDPIALRLAIAGGDGPSLYMARPCQYLESGPSNACDVSHWTTERFSRDVVGAFVAAITRYTASSNAEVILVGYSGGGVLATLVAQRLPKVRGLITVAAPIDHGAWIRHHRVSPLRGSLDPMEQSGIERLAGLPQVHFVGGKDEIVPLSVLGAFRARVAPVAPLKTWQVKAFDHQCCWAEQWPSLFGKAMDFIAASPPRT